MVIEKYSHVVHIVSNVEGKLQKGKNAFDVLRASFPAGTVSGAPKIRSMEIIDEFEEHHEGFRAFATEIIEFNNVGSSSRHLTIILSFKSSRERSLRAYNSSPFPKQ